MLTLRGHAKTDSLNIELEGGKSNAVLLSWQIFVIGKKSLKREKCPSFPYKMYNKISSWDSFY